MADASDDDYFAHWRRVLESAYLASDDPVAQSGFRGDLARWEFARGVIADGINGDGSFLDVGCANGLLIESMAAWAARRGYRLEPYGLDYSPALAALARRRLPQWADRIFVGNALTWQPVRRFSFVRTELVYVPERRRSQLVDRLLREVVEPEGRLLVCSYGSSRRPEPRVEPLGSLLRAAGFTVTGEADVRDDNGIVITRVAWLDRD